MFFKFSRELRIASLRRRIALFSIRFTGFATGLGLLAFAYEPPNSCTDALEALNVATFRGDWTQRDEAIRVELARHGKAGVPVYLVYAPDRPDAPHVLPELITVDSLIQSLERAAARRAI